MDKISIVTVTYNCKNDVEKTIKSVLDLDYPNIEYIVIDGASKDGTVDIIKTYADRIDYWISEPDKGIYDAMNKGIAVATGEWIYFLNAGDCFDDKGVLHKVPFDNYSQTTAVCAIVGDIKVNIDNNLSVRKKTIPFYRNQRRYKNMGFSHQGVFVRTKEAKNLLFDLQYALCADYAMMVSLHKKGLSFIEIDTPICAIQGGVGASASNRDQQMREEARICGCEDTIIFYATYCVRKAKRFIKNIIEVKR